METSPQDYHKQLRVACVNKGTMSACVNKGKIIHFFQTVVVTILLYLSVMEKKKTKNKES